MVMLFFFPAGDGVEIKRKSSKGKATSTNIMKNEKIGTRVKKCECKLHFINSAKGYLLGFT